jgi:hypothetical protein
MSLQSIRRFPPQRRAAGSPAAKAEICNDVTCGQSRVIRCDSWSLDGALTRFIRKGETFLHRQSILRSLSRSRLFPTLSRSKRR